MLKKGATPHKDDLQHLLCIKFHWIRALSHISNSVWDNLHYLSFIWVPDLWPMNLFSVHSIPPTVWHIMILSAVCLEHFYATQSLKIQCSDQM